MEGLVGCVFSVGRFVLRKCVVRGGGLRGHFGEVGLPVGIQECRERLTEDALNISACSLLQNGTARMVNANWRLRV